MLVNNAGWSVHAPVEQFTEEEIRAQFETVFFGPYRLTRTAVSGMRRRRFGVVVNMSSGASLEGRDSMGAYAAAKAAFDGEPQISLRILNLEVGCTTGLWLTALRSDQSAGKGGR